MKIKGTLWVTKLIDSKGEVAAIRYGKLFRKAWGIDGKDASEFTTKWELHVPRNDKFEIVIVK